MHIHDVGHQCRCVNAKRFLQCRHKQKQVREALLKLVFIQKFVFHLTQAFHQLDEMIHEGLILLRTAWFGTNVRLDYITHVRESIDGVAIEFVPVPVGAREFVDLGQLLRTVEILEPRRPHVWGSSSPVAVSNTRGSRLVQTHHKNEQASHVSA